MTDYHIVFCESHRREITRWWTDANGKILVEEGTDLMADERQKNGNWRYSRRYAGHLISLMPAALCALETPAQ